MKNIFIKAASVVASTALVGMTIGVAAAASYPSPFTSNTAVVVGAGAAASDSDAAGLVLNGLKSLSSSDSMSGDITGESVDLASGSDLLYLNDELSENVQTLTKADLPTVLADGTFTDDDGTDYDFEQILTIGTSTNNGFEFGNSDNDLDDPTLMLKLSTTATATNAIYDLTATFNTAVPFNATNSEGEDITIFGKTYTVGTATDADTLVLLGGSGSANINVGQTQSITVGATDYSVTLEGLSSALATQASVTVNGDTKTFTEGQTKTVGGIDVYVKTVFRTGDDGAGYAEIQLGAGKLTLEDGSAVQAGSDTDDVEGTLVTITGGVNATTELKITVAAADNDVNHLLVDGSFVDPVFGTVVVSFEGVDNGPTFSGEKDTGRTDLTIDKGGDRELLLSLTDNAGNAKTVPFTFEAALADDNGDAISIVEGSSLSDDEYFILNSGNNQHLMQITKLNLDATVANSDVEMKDIITGDTHKFTNKDFNASYSATILGQTYNITNDSTSTITVVSSDYGTGIADGNAVDVFPMIELVSGEDTRFAFTDDVTALDELITGNRTSGNTFTTVTLNLPTGTIDAVTTVLANSVTIGGEAIAHAADASIEVGDVFYNFAVTAGTGYDGTANNDTDVTVSIDATPNADSAAGVTTPGILFVEDEDKSETTTTTKPAIHIVTTDSGTFSTVSAPLFTGTSDTETWDDTKFTGWLTNFGTYVWRDTSDSDQNFVGLSYGAEIMSADVVIGEGEAIESSSGSSDMGLMSVTDTNIASAAGKHLIVIGGSAINSIAASLLDGAWSEGAFTDKTGAGPGDFIIQSFPSKHTTGKTALLVAGYNGPDTEKAVSFLMNNDVDTTTGYKYSGSSTTEATLEITS